MTFRSRDPLLAGAALIVLSPAAARAADAADEVGEVVITGELEQTLAEYGGVGLLLGGRGVGVAAASGWVSAARDPTSSA